MLTERSQKLVFSIDCYQPNSGKETTKAKILHRTVKSHIIGTNVLLMQNRYQTVFSNNFFSVTQVKSTPAQL